MVEWLVRRWRCGESKEAPDKSARSESVHLEIFDHSENNEMVNSFWGRNIIL